MSASFSLTGRRGFHVTFENGYTVSVQFGGGNYCEHYDDPYSLWDNRPNIYESCDAEVAVWAKDSVLIRLPEFNGDSVGANYSPGKVLALLNWAASQSGVTSEGAL